MVTTDSYVVSNVMTARLTLTETDLEAKNRVVDDDNLVYARTVVIDVPLKIPEKPLRANVRDLNDDQIHIYQLIEKEALERNFDPTLLNEIAWCESRYQMKWNYLHHTNPSYYTAYGVFQITAGTARSTNPNLDRFNLEDNIELAMQIYANRGTQPWDESKSCWSM